MPATARPDAVAPRRVRARRDGPAGSTLGRGGRAVRHRTAAVFGAVLLLGNAAVVVLPTVAADPPGLFLAPFEPKPIDPDTAPTVAAASFLEAAAPLPDSTRGQAVALASTGPLIADQEIQSIDLAAALRLCGARDLDVAIARARMAAAAADLQHARALWLPSIFIGPN